jgi:hypothetical protein
MGVIAPASKTVIEFASLPGEFATVGKLSSIRKPLAHVELCPEKNRVCQFATLLGAGGQGA